MDKETMRRTDKEEYHTVKKTRVRKRGFIVLGIIASVSYTHLTLPTICSV